VSFIPVANLPQVPLIPAAIFATGVVDTGGEPWLANISANFWKKIEIALVFFSGAWGKMINEKIWSKNLVTLSLLTCPLVQPPLSLVEELMLLPLLVPALPLPGTPRKRKVVKANKNTRLCTSVVGELPPQEIFHYMEMRAFMS
jgi:hypothetical protein